MSKNNVLFNATQAAKALGISRRTFYRWKENGNLKLNPIGKLKRYRSSDIAKILSNDDKRKLQDKRNNL